MFSAKMISSVETGSFNLPAKSLKALSDLRPKELVPTFKRSPRSGLRSIPREKKRRETGAGTSTTPGEIEVTGITRKFSETSLDDEVDEHKSCAKRPKMDWLIPASEGNFAEWPERRPRKEKGGRENTCRVEVDCELKKPEEYEKNLRLVGEEAKPEEVGLASVKYRFFQKHQKAKLGSALLLSNLYSRVYTSKRDRKHNPFKTKKYKSLKAHFSQF